MNKTRTKPSFHYFIRSGSALVPLAAETEQVPLPGQDSQETPPVTYGRYLRSVADYLSADSFKALKELLKRQPEPTPGFKTVTSLSLISEKHGALYNVARLRVDFPGVSRSFAVNAAFSPEQQAFLEVEYKILLELHTEFRLPYLPLPFLSGKTTLEDYGNIRLFISEWFEDHHEFHLSTATPGVPPQINIWRGGDKPHFISKETAGELYEKVSEILTTYLDTRSFRQVHPWHHAAGDFVVNDKETPVSVRLITARGYRSLLPRKMDAKDKVLGSLHFFVNLGIRMRIDRLDGTGELAWAGPESLAGVVRGFRKAWEPKTRKDRDLPEAQEVFSLFRSFTPEEKLAFAEIVARDGLVEAGERDFVAAHLPRHVNELTHAIKNVL